MSPRAANPAGGRFSPVEARVQAELRPTLTIVGPTAIGKTAVAVEVAGRAGGEVVSIDSRQVYRGVEIASNAPTLTERQAAVIHLVGILNPWERIDAARYARLARVVLDDIANRGAKPVLTAGTGLYLRALRQGLDLGGRPSDPGLRAELESTASAGGLSGLLGRLQELDPAVARSVDPANPVRVIRALELAILRRSHRSGTDPSPATPKPLPMTVVFLDADRPLLHGRIERRVAQMMASGLEAEVAALLRSDPPPASAVLRSIGVEEVAALIAGRLDRGRALEAIVVRTRNYAKRQLTWFRHEQPAHRIDVTRMETSDIVDAIFKMGLI